MLKMLQTQFGLACSLVTASDHPHPLPAAKAKLNIV
jgi:hypothetical protein